jgi:hypothetical protein
MELGLDAGHMMKHQYAYRSVGRRDIPSVSIGFGDRLKTVRTLIMNYLIKNYIILHILPNKILVW